MVCLMMLINLPWPRCSLPVDKHFLLLGRKFLLTYKFENIIVLYNLERDLIEVWLYPSKFVKKHITPRSIIICMMCISVDTITLSLHKNYGHCTNL